MDNLVMKNIRSNLDFSDIHNMSLVCKTWNVFVKDSIKATHLQTIFDAIGLDAEHCKHFITSPSDLLWTLDTIIEAIFAPDPDNYTRKNHFFESQVERCKIKYNNKHRLKERRLMRQSYNVYALLIAT